MPTLSRFYGIVVYMNFGDHNPPHFHVRYQDQEVSVELHTGLVVGTMARRALQMVFEWAALHEQELIDNWERARNREPLVPIAPLP